MDGFMVGVIDRFIVEFLQPDVSLKHASRDVGILPYADRSVAKRPLAKVHRLLPSLCLILCCPGLAATNFSGFGTLGFGKVNTNVATILEYDDHWTARSDSVLGVQIDHQLMENVSITTQIIAQDTNYNDATDFETGFEWLFLSYNYTGTTQIRLGRLRNPMLIFSNVLAVGYAQTWVRPPLNIYIPHFTAITNFDGIDMTFSRSLFGQEADLSLYAGVMDDNFTNLTVKADSMLGARVDFLFDHYSVRYGLGFARVSNTINAMELLRPAFQNLSNLSPIFGEIAAALRIEAEWFHQHTLGVQTEWDNWALILELSSFSVISSEVTSRTSGAYLSLGYQFDSFMPYGLIGYSDNLYRGELFDLLAQSYAVLPQGVSAGLDQLRGTAGLIFDETKNTGFSWTFGCRYDFHPQAALKFEFQYFENQSHATPMSLPASGDSILLSTIVVDFVF